MRSFFFASDGQLTNITGSSYLCIVWAKHNNDVYIHHAYAVISNVDNTLFNEPCAIIDTVKTVRLIKSPKDIRELSIKGRCYLQYRYIDGSYHVELNSAEVLEVLMTNMFTTGKDGRDLQPKEYPQSISIQINNSEHSILFDINRGFTPYLTIKPHLHNLDRYDKIAQFINFQTT